MRRALVAALCLCAACARPDQRTLAGQQEPVSVEMLVAEASKNPLAAEARHRRKLTRFVGRVRRIGTSTHEYEGSATASCSTIGQSTICNSRGPKRYAVRTSHVILESPDTPMSGAVFCSFGTHEFDDAALYEQGSIADVAGYVREIRSDPEAGTIVIATECFRPRHALNN